MNDRIQKVPPHAPSRAAPTIPDLFVQPAARLRVQRPLRRPRLQQVASHLRNNRIELAKTMLDEHLARHPGDADAIWLMARAAVRLGLAGEAALLLARCLELAPDFAVARFDYAKLLLRL